MQVYGFDYDYTLACYKPQLEDLLYNLAREMLVKRFRYPDDILDLEYEPNFAVRGLHYDVEKGLLVKLDSFLQLQLGSVYRGRTKVEADEVLKLYHNRLLPIAYVEGPNMSYRVREPDEPAVFIIILLPPALEIMLILLFSFILAAQYQLQDGATGGSVLCARNVSAVQCYRIF